MSEVDEEMKVFDMDDEDEDLEGLEGSSKKRVTKTAEKQEKAQRTFKGSTALEASKIGKLVRIQFLVNSHFNRNLLLIVLDFLL